MCKASRICVVSERRYKKMKIFLLRDKRRINFVLKLVVSGWEKKEESDKSL